MAALPIEVVDLDLQVARQHPGGYAERAATYEGGRFDQPEIDFAKLAESAGAHGTNVDQPDQLRPALERAIETVRQGAPAVIAVKVE